MKPQGNMQPKSPNPEPHLMTGFLSLLLLLACTCQPAISTDTETSHILKNSLQPLIDQQKVSGLAAGVIRDNSMAFYGAGRCHMDSPTAPTKDTLFEIGSITKLFTALLLARLAEKGVVEYTDPMHDYLPCNTVRSNTSTEAINLFSLATHTSGLPRLPGNIKPANLNNPYADYTPQLLCTFLASYKPRYPPWKHFEYSNLGYGVLGQCLVTASGSASYEQLIQEQITRPLSLHNTTTNPNSEQIAQMAQGHTIQRIFIYPPVHQKSRNQFTPAEYWDIPTLTGAGGLKSTVQDLLLFMAAHLDERATDLSSAMRTTLIPRWWKNETEAVGLGWQMRRLSKTSPWIFWHNGGTGGFHSYIAFVREEKTGLVLLVNCATDVDTVGSELLRKLLDQKKTPIPSPEAGHGKGDPDPQPGD